MSPQVKLEWPGKRPPALRQGGGQLSTTQTFGNAPHTNRLVASDCFAAAEALMPEYAASADLIYIDPPFFAGKDRDLRLPAGQPEAAVAYEDTWNNDPCLYLQWLYDLVFAARGLLKEEGSLYLHLGWQAAHCARLLMDELFGPERFQNEIIWCYREAINSRKRWNRKHDTILFYTNSDRFKFYPDRVLEEYSATTIKKFRHADEIGKYRLMGRGITSSPLRSKRDLAPEMETLFPELTYRHYLGAGTLPVDYWLIDIENQASPLRTGYPTQKPEALLERIILASSDPDDLVADLCCGSGTTLAVANRLGRRWVGCDSGQAAIDIARKRLVEAGASFSCHTVVGGTAQE